ncbi:tRNA threonylcarbamoyladenosine biosynthesis protein TsaB [Oikeobacillus pervagus]|uniref:tRNA threonylcarbamoyladenosine biosynthesis protein TsaB n=1 Tax=Oikeobacillus pervagus TaxID=1325931 RepID=A0AAJ1T7B5_9BACI|nr:tRNA (adenosine(37)-N6)-threonylcarbamoyltransferase complex dimerization subunit type 1 TsaB [Oikeobacillus pervagus]MDQ0216471.1 tRNA threonylcarbamoyladenosine biosynthesis protein TsaB [Oikeobacillus pervagus]
MTVLAIDTSNYVLGLSLLTEEKVIGEYITNIKKNHSLRVMPAIESFLKDCEVETNELSKIVVAKGPGSYTGVRIGMTIAKTLAWSLHLPLISVSSLAVLAASARYYPKYISPIFDARRGQVYTGLYQFINGELTTVRDDCNILMDEWCRSLKELNEPVLFVGNDVALHLECIHNTLETNGLIGEYTTHNPRPAELGRIGLLKEAENVHTAVPNYIRLAEAEAKWLQNQRINGEK